MDGTRRVLGRTGLEVTTLGYGAMELRGERPAVPTSTTPTRSASSTPCSTPASTSSTPRSTTAAARSSSASYIANRRGEYYLASKCGCVPGAPAGSDHVHTAENIRAGVEHSLRLMKTDHLDLVQFHRSLTARTSSRPKGALGELLKLRDEGKVRFVGVSGTLPNLDEQIDMGVFDAFQIPYSALQREHEDAIAQAAAAGAGIIIRGGVARGAPEDWERPRYYMVTTDTMKQRWDEAKLDELLDGMDRVAWLLRFTLSLPA